MSNNEKLEKTIKKSSKLKNKIKKIDNSSEDEKFIKKSSELKNKIKKSSLKKNNLGQYFTTNENLQKKLYSFILNKPSLILEPSIGAGDLINFVLSKSPKIKFDMYEIDNTINFLNKINKKNIIFGDFLKLSVNKTYDTIIGNPPYVLCS